MSDPILVEVSNRQSTVAVDEQQLVRAVQLVARENHFESAEISIGIVDDKQMHRLNVQYLDHDYPTDVLSFPLQVSDGFLVGEIIVSADTACRQAEEHGLTPVEELILYVIHGALHLVGYDDKEENDRKMMKQMEARFMQLMGVVPAISDPKASATSRLGPSKSGPSDSQSGVNSTQR